MIIEFPTAATQETSKATNSIIAKLYSKKGLQAFNGILLNLIMLLDANIKNATAADPANNLKMTMELCKELQYQVKSLPEHKQIAANMIIELIGDIIVT